MGACHLMRADLLIQTNRGINSGLLKAEPRSAGNTTPTTLEQVAASIFAPAFRAAADASLVDRLTGRVLRDVVLAARTKPRRLERRPLDGSGRP